MRITLLCPTEPDPDNGCEGCGETIVVEPDEENYASCPRCGLHFDVERARELTWLANVPIDIEYDHNATVTVTYRGESVTFTLHGDELSRTPHAYLSNASKAHIANQVEKALIELTETR